MLDATFPATFPIKESVLAAQVIHFGVDEFHRVPVLRRAGYIVEDCPSLRHLYPALIQFPKPDVVAVSEHDETDREEAISLVRLHSASTLVLFQGRRSLFDPAAFSLVVPCIADPRVWLADLAGAVANSRMVREQSRYLRLEAGAIREISRLERRRSASLLNRNRSPQWYEQDLRPVSGDDGPYSEGGLLFSAAESRVPELIIGYDENSHPVSAICSACGDGMLPGEPRVSATGEMIRWFSMQFASHVRFKHSRLEHQPVN